MKAIYKNQTGDLIATFSDSAALIAAAAEMAGASMTVCQDGTYVFWVDEDGDCNELLPCECSGVIRLIKDLSNVAPDATGRLSLWVRFITRYERVEVITMAEAKMGGLIEIPFSSLDEADLGIRWGHAATSASTIGEAIAAATGLTVVANAILPQ